MTRIEQINALTDRLEYLGLAYMAKDLPSLLNDPRAENISKVDFLEKLITNEYVQNYNNKYTRDLRLSRLSSREGDVKQLYSHDGRLYNENVLNQVKDFAFLENGHNVCIFGASGVGKSYCLISLGIEACKRGIVPLFTDFIDLTDELSYLRDNNMQKYYKRLRHYQNVPLLLIDDFLSTNIGINTVSSLFQLIKEREFRRKPIIVSTQYDPQEWVQLMTSSKNRKGEADSIRRRLTDCSYLITISKP